MVQDASDPKTKADGSGYQEPTVVEAAQEALDPDALYGQGMAHYRRRRWREARSCFEQVKTLQPSRRGIDALLRELDIFLQLESVENESSSVVVSDQAAASEAEAVEEAEEEPRRSGGLWKLLLVLGVAAIVVVGVYAFRQGLLPFSRDMSEQNLRNLGQAYLVAQQYEKALDTYGKLLTLIPEDPEALNGLKNAKDGLYEEGQSYEQAGNLTEALKRYITVCRADGNYQEACSGVDRLEMRQRLDEMYREARGYLDSKAYSKAIDLLLKLRASDPQGEYKPGTISDDLYEAYMGQADQLIGLAASGIEPAAEAKPEAPKYNIQDATLSNIRQAANAYKKALAERVTSDKAKFAISLIDDLHEGLERYRDWAWPESIKALSAVYGLDHAYLSGKTAAVLCDAHLHQGDLYAQKGDFTTALAEYRVMQQIEGCNSGVVQGRIQTVQPTATPTITSTPEPTATPTATNTPRPSLTPTPAPTGTPTPTDTPQPPPTKSGSGGGGGGSKPPPPKPPTRKPA